MKLLSMRALRLIAMSAALWHSLLHLQLVEGAVATPQTEKPADQANIDALQKLAQQESESGQTSEAIRDYKRVLELRPEWKEGWWNLGVLEYGANQFADAVVSFTTEFELVICQIKTDLGLTEPVVSQKISS